ncbi:polysaccharide lyase family 7 protein [Aquimarina sp. MMG016]|uniref:polysaccharide lyase family 7 protein n=1 Tax=Aquimarina sp. MMG016 TaxID=2822690 RepID=UPI001B3A48FF|nr:polysaccharide lyase family 7 protein [Aquimarina sp. MMG016]MBQ4821004.1 polysaccharide lyase family 7 protein [Aquimarina sp. MMG016]
MKNYLINRERISFSRLHKLCLFSVFFITLSCENEGFNTEITELTEESIGLKAIITPASVSANGDDGNVPANTLDGNLNTRWSSKGYSGKYITYDLGSPKTISSLKIAWYKGNQRKAYFKIRVGNSTSSLSTVFDAKRTGSSGNTTNLETYSFNEISARYVRISCFGNSSGAWNSITETQIHSSGSTPPPPPPPGGNSPGDILGLTSNTWKLNCFTGSPGSSATYRDDVLDATGETFSTYEDPNYFYTDGEWTYFKCYRGLGGSANSQNPRVELRELKNGNLASWDAKNGNNTMTWTVRVDQLPKSKSGKDGVLCFGQIHGPGNTVDDVIRVQFIGSPDQSSGNVRIKISGYITEEVLGGSRILSGTYKLDTSYTFKLVYNDGLVELFEGGNRIFSQEMDTSTEGNYFKVGNYLQSVKGASYTGSHGIVRVKNLSITH